MYGRIVVQCTIEVLFLLPDDVESKTSVHADELTFLSSRFRALVSLTVYYDSGRFKIQDNSKLVQHQVNPQSSHAFYKKISGCIQIITSSAKTRVSRASFDSSRLSSSSSSLFISSALFKIQLTNRIEYRYLEHRYQDLHPLPCIELKKFSPGYTFSITSLSAFLKL